MDVATKWHTSSALRFDAIVAGMNHFVTTPREGGRGKAYLVCNEIQDFFHVQLF